MNTQLQTYRQLRYTTLGTFNEQQGTWSLCDYWITHALLLFTAIVSFGVPGMLTDLFRWHVLALGNTIPPFSVAWAPVAFCGLAYAYYLQFRAVPVTRSFLILITFILFFITIETAVAIHGGIIPDYSYVIQITWVSFLYITLLGLSGVIGATSLIFIVPAIGAIMSVVHVLPLNIYHPQYNLLGYLYSIQRIDWKYTNEFSYAAAFGATTALYAVLIRKWKLQSFLMWATFYLLNIFGIVFNKSRGAWIVLLVASSLIIAGRLVRWRGSYTIIFGAILTSFIVLQMLFSPIPKVNDILSLRRGLTHQKEITVAGVEEIEIHRVDVATSLGERVQFIKIWLKNMTNHFQVIGMGASGLDQYRLETAKGSRGIHGIPFILTLAYGMAGVLFLFYIVFTIAGCTKFLKLHSYGITILAIMLVASLMLMRIPLWFALGAILVHRANDIQRSLTQSDQINAI